MHFNSFCYKCSQAECWQKADQTSSTHPHRVEWDKATISQYYTLKHQWKWITAKLRHWKRFSTRVKSHGQYGPLNNHLSPNAYTSTALMRGWTGPVKQWTRDILCCRGNRLHVSKAAVKWDWESVRDTENMKKCLCENQESSLLKYLESYSLLLNHKELLERVHKHN